MTGQDRLYFGYGANSSPLMMEAIIGRRPEGFKAKLMGYALYVQAWEEIPEAAKKILQPSWDKDFRSYIAVPEEGALTWGMAWYLTSEELPMVGNWELHGIWYTPIQVQIVDLSGRSFEGETEVILSTNSPMRIDGETYPIFLNDQEQMIRVAEETRQT